MFRTVEPNRRASASYLFDLRFQYKVAVAMVISGVTSLANFVLVALLAGRRCGDLGCNLSLAQDFGLLLIFGILLVGFGIVTAIFAWESSSIEVPVLTKARRPRSVLLG